MFAEKRRKLILELLQEKESISVNELAESLNVSLPTVRADLDFLDKERKLERTHGGAILINAALKGPREQSYDTREKINIEKKKEIANKAYELIGNSECIILDSSTTCFELATLLKETDKELTILTNGFKTANILRENLNLTVVIIGGIIRKNSNAMEGLLGEEVFKKLNVDKVFFSSYGVSVENGFSDFNLYEIELKKKMLNASSKKLALIDSTKFNMSSIASFADLNDVSTIITDKELDSPVLDHYKNYTNIVV
ncbi:DeoR/GlpR family DNA-binding transcription regulator [Oceanobacillus manasiensis]|uniref:DeoR/GlpR family DNA-binding transcription regulator n=1 Tax=Oceanobacillus manasiensis TaxID=586413 RepID=UPI0005A99816|nr:DeoR/GlpR family DNA-binding transcription regulator [Oceanobacillus manasiensis]